MDNSLSTIKYADYKSASEASYKLPHYINTANPIMVWHLCEVIMKKGSQTQILRMRHMLNSEFNHSINK